MIKKIATTFSFFILVLSITGCGLFTSHYDATRHQNFTKLKALHFKLYDDWTTNGNKLFNSAAIKLYCSNGDLSFREALEYAKSKDNADRTGEKAVSILSEQFKADCEKLIKSQSLFSKVYIKELKTEVNENYSLAINGEESRVK